MPSFKKAKDQAHIAIMKKNAINQPRHGHQKDGMVHSLGTARNYEQALKGYTQWIKDNRLGDLWGACKDTAILYLVERAESGLGQKAIDLDRQAIQCHLGLGVKLPRIMSLNVTALRNRAYTQMQIMEIASHQTTRYALATQIAAAAGLRSHELLTIRPLTERGPSSHRQWSQDRFHCRSGELYSVVGKGGLVRVVLVPYELAAKLEARRLQEAKTVYDRGIRYQTWYDLPGGQRWSQSFSHASQKWLGWSTGGHGVRFTYAQERMSELQGDGYSRDDALAVVAQEMGHFSPSTTEVYLRQ